MLSKIFPKTNELTVFVIAVVLYVTVIFNIELISALASKLQILWGAWQDDYTALETLFDKIKHILGLLTFVFLCIVYLVGPLLMPFTHKDIRALSLIILWIDAVLIIYWNIKSTDLDQWYRLFPVVYGVAWLAYSLFVIKADSTHGIRKLVTNEQTTPKTALRIAGLGSFLSLFFMHVMNLWWLDAYMLALVLTFMAVNALTSLTSGEKSSIA